MTGPNSHTLLARDGIALAYSEWNPGASGSLLVFVHATGFCKEVCYPIIEDLDDLRPGFRVVALDQRAHGDSGVPEPPFDWWRLGSDIVELVGDAPAVVGVGHSAGGAALVMAEMQRPGLFDALVLVEPIVFPPPYGRFPHNPMSVAARRRRDRFASKEAAFESWRTKGVFAGWEERALWAYVNGGLREQDGEFFLKCSPDAEAETFAAATEHGAWDRLGEVSVVTKVIAGERSTTHQEPFLKQLVGRMPHAEYVIVPDTSHMVWMERPEVIAKHVAGFI